MWYFDIFVLKNKLYLKKKILSIDCIVLAFLCIGIVPRFSWIQYIFFDLGNYDFRDRSISKLDLIFYVLVPSRFVLWLISFFGYAVQYMLLTNLNIAITDTIEKPHKHVTGYSNNSSKSNVRSNFLNFFSTSTCRFFFFFFYRNYGDIKFCSFFFNSGGSLIFKRITLRRHEVNWINERKKVKVLRNTHFSDWLRV